ncbi:DUF3667 domain-containing protein [Arachidicoccus terrestris]|uniref:DUF3667 domain-containing protein n=1 Tax=Arachidicoccus terrestris TaxID=2875539 RepID=UPI001CC3AF55|nr:DUF3667 domain-containing protein [Arachidicoccus terrestris]UAY57193.1 DUF3667 domain-containing protein [Arachidicoccus terrestris]
MKDQAVQDPPDQGDVPLHPCPNCGFDASGHYCANCGQQTHLHKDTFWGLISHFVAHYFHYDSKFWRTLSALVTAPGKLTVAYQQKKRQSYIPPISLYIFVSIVFFLLLPMFQQSLFSVKYGDAKQQKVEEAKPDSIKDVSIQKLLQEDAKKNGREINAAEKYTSEVGDDLLSELRENPKEFKERLMHSFPKIFFFMIPVLAGLLKLFLIRQKKYYFVDHAVFALHMHSFVFIICIIPLINPFDSLQTNLSNIALIACILYYIIAIHRVYKSGWIKSTIIGLSTAALYFIALLLVTLLDLWLLFSLQR